jgi:Lipase (class 3)
MATNYTAQQTNLALAYIASAGSDLPSPQEISEISTLIQESLDTSAATKNQFDIVWGPASYRFPLSKFDSNLMFIVQSKEDPNDYRIVIRATNSISLFDWLVEDFWTINTVPWSKFDPQAPSQAQISCGTATGMAILLNLRPATDQSGEGLDLQEYIQKMTSTGQKISLTITGHSLAGALSATLGLLLQKHLNNNTQLTIQASAGPSAGNLAFANYSEQQLGARLSRLHNTLDVVPHAWETKKLLEIPLLYLPAVKPNAEIIGLVGVATAATLKVGYTQINPSPALIGKINNDAPHFMEQVSYQHVEAYPSLLNMQQSDIVICKGTSFSPLHGTA